MTVRSPASWIQGGSHPAENDRNLLAALVGTPGIVGSADLAVTANGTPNMTVNVAAGAAFVKGTETTYQGIYHVFNDATVNLAIAASDPTNPRIDIVVAQVRDAFYSGASNDFRLVVVTGTPAGSPAAPATPADSIVLARVAVAALVTTIITGYITDYRTRAMDGMTANPYKAKARNSSSTIYNGMSQTKIALTSVDYDPNSNFATSRYTAPVAGYYDIRARLQSAGYVGAIGDPVQCMIYKNGVELDRAVVGAMTAAGLALSLAGIYLLAAGDYIELYGQIGATSNATNSWINTLQYSSLTVAYHSAP